MFSKLKEIKGKTAVWLRLSELEKETVRMSTVTFDQDEYKKPGEQIVPFSRIHERAVNSDLSI